jgi:hypothetical protein
MYMGKMVLGRQKYRQQSYLCQSLVSLRLRLLLERRKGIKSLGANQIPAELIQARGETMHPEVQICLLGYTAV